MPNINWEEASDLCERQNATLVKIDNFEERKGLAALSLTKWFEDIYLSKSVVIFIGLRNKINGDLYRLKWSNNEPMIYHEWFGRAPILTYSYVSSDLAGIVSKTLPQPSVENNNQQCTAMMMQHPLYWLNWVKIPCSSKFESSSFICEKPIHGNGTTNAEYHLQQIREINNLNGIRCEDSWILQNKRCLMIIGFDSLDNIDIVDVCRAKNSTLSTMTPVEVLESKDFFDGLWPHEKANLHYLDNDVQTVLLDNASFHHVICEKPPVAWSFIKGRYATDDNLFWCGGQDQYWISIDNLCDTKVDCIQSRDDEKECTEYRNKFLLYRCDDVRNDFISWNRFCDFTPNCINKADEAQCIHPSCQPNKDWRCSNGQCIDINKRCDQEIDCLDGSDEKECKPSMCNGFNCSSSVCLPRKYVNDDIVDCPGVLMEDEFFQTSSMDKENCSQHPERMKLLCGASSNKCMERNSTCIYRRDNLGSRDVCPMMNHLQNCASFKCPGLFQCPKMKYCLQLQYVCDGVMDCTNGEDENTEACRNLSCPFHFRCWSHGKKQLICVERKHLCNGIKECSNGDDEKYCDVNECQRNCHCFGHVVNCVNTTTSIISNFIWSTRAIAIHKTPKIYFQRDMFARFTYLGYLDLSDNYISRLPRGLFESLYNLIVLDLSRNKITILPSYTFKDLQNLKRIDLSNNPIETLEPFCLSGLVSITSISLISMRFSEVPDNMFVGTSLKLVSINLSNNDISVINKDAFLGVNNLSSLDITVKKVDISIIGQPLSHITVKTVQTNIYKICCSLAKFEFCSAETDISSNCDNLLANYSIQVIVWIMGITGLIGNVVVIIWRIIYFKKGKEVSNEDILVMNLAMSDMLLSIYLIIIASTDRYYRNEYVENSFKWKSSLLCTVSGLLATVSNQASVSFLGLITLDRVICIVLTSWKEYVRFIRHAIVPLWIVWIISIPLFELSRYLKHENFQSNGLCLSYFTLDNQSSVKSTFSMGLIIYILIFLSLIVFGYIAIFVHSCRTRRSAGRGLMLNDYKSARKMLILVLVFCLCWFPIIILSFITKYLNYKMTNDQVTWLTMILMPLNTCLNPYMYTFSNVELCFKINKYQSNRKKQNISTLSSSVSPHK